jgi:hypothetical protein
VLGPEFKLKYPLPEKAMNVKRGQFGGEPAGVWRGKIG